MALIAYATFSTLLVSVSGLPLASNKDNSLVLVQRRAETFTAVGLAAAKERIFAARAKDADAVELVVATADATARTATTSSGITPACGYASDDQANFAYLDGHLVSYIDLATLVQNNLGNMGPSPGDPVIKFKNVGRVGNTNVSLVIKNLTEYLPAGQSGSAPNGRSSTGKFGFVNMKCGTQSLLKFSFLNAETDEPVKIKQMHFTYFDLDAGNRGEVVEYLGAVTNFSASNLYTETEVTETKEACNNTFWKASTPGTGKDNPSDPLNLTPDQEKRTVTITYDNISSVMLIFGMTTRNDGSCGNGRNFMYAFENNKTSSPTPSPTVIQECDTCVVWGDPHIISFQAHRERLAKHPHREEFFRTRDWKSDQFTVAEGGNGWLLNTDEVKIEADYTKNVSSNTTFLSAITIGGRFLDNNALVILPLSGQNTWGDQEILSDIPSTFSDADKLINASYTNSAKMVKDGSVGPGIVLQLPMGVTLTVNRWPQSLAVEIEMCQPMPARCVGACCAS